MNKKQHDKGMCRLALPVHVSKVHILVVILMGIATLLIAQVPPTYILAQGDITPPLMVDIQIEPKQVNTSNGPQTITITAEITDNLSGFKDGFIVFASEVATTQSHSVSFGEHNLVSGDSREGVYQDTFILPQFAAEGRWLVRQVTVGDIVGNNETHFPFPEEYSSYEFTNGTIPEPTNSITYLPAVVRSLESRSVDVDFGMIEKRLWDIEETGGQVKEGGSILCGDKRELHVIVLDSDGKRLNGIAVQALYGAQETFVTGEQDWGDGEAVFVLGAEQAVKIIRDSDGREVTSDVVDGITTHSPEIPHKDLIAARYCTSKESCDNFNYSAGCWGHHSWTVTFRQIEYPFVLDKDSAQCTPNIGNSYFSGYVRRKDNSLMNGVCVHIAIDEPRATKCTGCDGVGDGNWGFSPFGGPAKGNEQIEIFVVQCEGEMPLGGQTEQSGFGSLTPLSPKWTHTMDGSEQCTGITFYKNQ